MSIGQIRDDSDISIECFARASSLTGPVEATIETLREYDRRDVIAELAVETWPAEVVCTDEGTASPALAQYRRFRQWATEEDVSLQPAFTLRERTTLVDDHADVVLTLPMLCLAVSVDGELTTVAPHRTDYTVNDVLAELATLDRPTAESTAAADGPAVPPLRATDRPRAPAACPQCDGSVVTGQGVYACRTCSWHGITFARGETSRHGTGPRDPSGAEVVDPPPSDSTDGPEELSM